MEDSQVTSGATQLHPNVDILIDYYQEKLDADAAEPIQEHVAHCRQCTALLLDLQDFSLAESAPPPAQDFEMSQLLTRVISSQVHTQRWRNTALLAASILLVTSLAFALVYRSLDQRDRVLEQRDAEVATAALSPEINLPITSLYPRSSIRGGGENRLELPSGPRLFSIILTTTEIPSFSDYMLVFSDRTGHEVLSLSGLQPTPIGTFTLALPTSLLQPGLYRLELLGLRDGRKTLVDEYPLEIVKFSQLPSSKSLDSQRAGPR